MFLLHRFASKEVEDNEMLENPILNPLAFDYHP
jgi:hypothetical protein